MFVEDDDVEDTLDSEVEDDDDEEDDDSTSLSSSFKQSSVLAIFN